MKKRSRPGVGFLRGNHKGKLDQSVERSCRSLVESIESRILMSDTMFAATPASVLRPISINTVVPATGYSSPTGLGLTAAKLRGAYGLGTASTYNISFNGVQGDGTGQTIALIDYYNDPTIQSDLQIFDAAMGLPNPPSFQVLNQTGQTSPLPSNDVQNPSSQSDWAPEVALDVEYSHVMAPGASIILFECSSNLEIGDQTAASWPGVTVVSNSWGSSESSTEATAQDKYFVTPTGHAGVTFFASTGDSGAELSYPAESPNVVAVGGTALTVSSSNTWSSETTWSSAGGGTSAYEPQPSWQAGTVTSTKRENPDVSMDASPSTGVPIYDAWDYGTGTGWDGAYGGTSLSSPMFAGVVAVANQGRAAEGLPSLNSTQTLTRLYQLAKTNYHDITTGSNGHAATAGYDEATGIGTPIANLLVPNLAGAGAVTGRMFVDNGGNGVYGGSDTPLAGKTVYLDLNNDGSLDNGEPSMVTDANGLYSFSDQPAGGSVRLASATIAGYTLTSASTATIAYGASETVNFTYQATPAQVQFTAQPNASTTFGNAIGSVAVTIENSLGTTVGNDSSTVTLTLNQGTFASGLSTATATAVNGVATFNGLTISSVGTYTFTATDGSLSGTSSNSFTVVQATPTVSWSNPADISYGTALSGTQLNATASTGGTFSYNPAAGTVLSPGSNQTLSVLFTPNDTVDYTTASTSVAINVTGVVAQPINLSGNAFYVERDSANLSNLDIWTSATPTGTPAVSQSLNSISSITLSGNAVGDTFTVDLSNGTVIPTGGLTFAGYGTASANSLTVVGTGGSDTVTIPGDGTDNVNSLTVNYSTSSIGKVYFASPGTGESLTVPAGTVTIAPGTASGFTNEVFTSVSVASNASLVVPAAASQAQRVILSTGALTLGGSTSNWTGSLDLNSNDLAVTGGSLTDLSSQVAQGFNTGVGGILSSTALNSASRLTTLGVIQNSVDGTSTGSSLYGSGTTLGLFDGTNPSSGTVLVKYTYFGDANLDGTVDGSDYSLIDSGVLTQANGWFNGDFNYDGVTNGSDYTLIDNAFNQQGASLAAQVVTSAGVKGSAASTVFAQPASSTAVQSTQATTNSVADQIFSSDSDLLPKKAKFSSQLILG